jgi:hypothetical protein
VRNPFESEDAAFRLLIAVVVVIAAATGLVLLLRAIL